MHSNPYTHDNARRGALHYLMGRGVAGIAGFLTIILLVRYMDLVNYAAYTAMSGLVAICGVLAGLGMERVVSRFVPEGRLHQSVDRLARFIWITGLVRLMAALLLVILLYVCWPLVDDFLAVSDFGTFSIALACFIVAEVMFQHFSSVLQSLVMQKTLTQLLIIQWAGRLLMIAGFVLMKSGMDWEDAMWVFAIPELLGVAGFAVVTSRHLRSLPDPEPAGMSGKPWPLWSSVCDISIHNYGFTLLAAPPQGYFMKLLTAAYLPVEIVAAYGFFISIAEKARQYIPLHFFYGLLEPMMIASYLKDHDFESLSQRCQLLYKSNLLIMVPAIAWVAVAGDAIVSIMTGGKFQEFSWILVIVMIQLTIGSHAVLLQLILNALDKSRLLVQASLVALPVMLGCMLMAIILSSDWLIVSPIVFSLVMNLFIVIQLAVAGYSYQPSWKMLVRIIASGILGFFAIKLLGFTISFERSWMATATLTLIGVTSVYVAAIWLCRAIERSEIEHVRKFFFNVRRSGVVM